MHPPSMEKQINRHFKFNKIQIHLKQTHNNNALMACAKIRARRNPFSTMKKSVKYWYTLGFGGNSFHLFIIGGRIGQGPSRICDEKTPDTYPEMWTDT